MKRRIILYNSPVILTFAFVSLAVLFMDELTNGWTTLNLFCVYRSSLADPLTYPRFFLHVLGHSGFPHYINNMLLLLVVGPPLEEKYGSRNILIAFFITAFISGLVQWLFFPGSALLGASGIVFMLILMSSLSGKRGSGVPLTLILVAALYIGGEIVNGLFTKDNVSQLTHIIGGICGAALGFYFIKHRK
jgi:membrane associated rhomboid family serine protease